MRLINKALFLATALTLPAAMSFAAEATAPANTDKGNDYNMALISLVGLVFILLFVIGMLANTLKHIGTVVRDKKKQAGSGAANVVKVLLVAALALLPAAQTFAAEKEPVAQSSAFIEGMPAFDFYMLIAIIALELIIAFMLVIYIQVLTKALRQQSVTEGATAKAAPKESFWDKFHAAKAIEQEKDILLDHNYDGIQELDNSLPPWWKYGFYLTIIVGLIYVYRFHISHDGPSQAEEFATEMEKGEADKAAYLAKSANNVDENSVAMLSDANELAAGKELFLKNCAACHLADGGGVVGPNLTDEYWIHGGGIKNIFKSVKYGWQDKGMKSWKDDLSPKQIQQVSSFIVSLKGTHPATPKAPQGDLYIEAAVPATDTAKKDTAKVAAN